MREAYLTAPVPMDLNIGTDVVAAARQWLGTPFHWEASVRGVGCDCRGLLTGVARDLGRPEARAIEANVVGYSRRIDSDLLMAGLGRVFALRHRYDAIAPGDILAFRIGRRDRVQHLGIMGAKDAKGADRFIHAHSADPAQVIETPLDALFQGRSWVDRLAGVWTWRDLGRATGEERRELERAA